MLREVFLVRLQKRGERWIFGSVWGGRAPQVWCLVLACARVRDERESE